MGDPWYEMVDEITGQVEGMKKHADEVKADLLAKVENAKRDAIFAELAKLNTKVDALAARLPDDDGES